jgi:signal transduction histidine kinase
MMRASREAVEKGLSPSRSAREFATESIVVQVRWLGVLMGYVLVLVRIDALRDPVAVGAMLALGAGYAALDAYFHYRGEGFLRRWPLFVSTMESIFLALLCYYDTGLDSPFRWYYLLSLICCAIRYPRRIAWLTFAMHCLSLLVVTWALGPSRARADSLALILAMLAWVTWAVSSLAGMLRATGERLEAANAALELHGAELEARVAERTEALRTSQARMIHQEKMAAFGLLAAGIAHEVGNPLAALSSLVQMLQRRGPDPYTADKLELAGRQLARIQRTVRELTDFSRPGSTALGPLRLAEVVDEALGIAKYYQRTKQREIRTEIAPGLPPVRAVRDHITQVVLNLLLNAVDATIKGGKITLRAWADDGRVVLEVEDDGRGVAEADRPRLFQPFFTTKPRGTGLGLYISRQIVEELGGSMTYRTDLDAGTTFTIRLNALASRVPIDETKGGPTDDERRLDAAGAVAVG